MLTSPPLSLSSRYTWCHEGHTFNMQCAPGRAVSEHFYWSQTDPCTEIDTQERCVIGFLKNMHREEKVYDATPQETLEADTYFESEPEARPNPEVGSEPTADPEPEVGAVPVVSRPLKSRSHIVETVSHRRRFRARFKNGGRDVTAADNSVGRDEWLRPQPGPYYWEVPAQPRAEYVRQPRAVAARTTTAALTTPPPTAAGPQLEDDSKLISKEAGSREGPSRYKVPGRGPVLEASSNEQDRPGWADMSAGPQQPDIPEKGDMTMDEYEPQNTVSQDTPTAEQDGDEISLEKLDDGLFAFINKDSGDRYHVVNTHVVEEM